jgi:hypothetical protein
MNDKSSSTGTRSQLLQINKDLVLDSLNAACLIGSWARWVKSTATLRPGEWPDLEMEQDIECWSLVVELSRLELTSYDQVNQPDKLAAIMTGLSVALLLSSDKHEYFAIRREWHKIERWLKSEHGVEPGEHGWTLLDNSSSSLVSAETSLDVIGKYLPELKQGWNDGKAAGVQDYLTVMRLKLMDESGAE